MYRIQIIVVCILLIAFTKVQAQDTQSALIVDYDPNHITQGWQNWQQNYMEFVSANGRDAIRIVSNASTRATYSEGQAYGMLFAVAMNDQPMYDRLWQYAQSHLNRNGLMSWHIASYGQVLDEGAATDADLDMAMSLIYACRRIQVGDWQSSHDYCNAATAMINAIWTHEIDKPGSQPYAGLNNNQGYELLPGDRWCLQCDFQNGIVNLSYFSPAYITAFADFTNNPQWEAVNTRNYDLMEQSQTIGCSKLVPNWVTYQGQVQSVPWQGSTSAYWGWDAARVSWRLAMARYWFDDERASNVLNDVGGFFDGVQLNNIRSEYRLNGTAVNSYTDTFFVAHAANAIWGMTSPNRSRCDQIGKPGNTTRQQAYNAVYNRSLNNYYNDSWRLLTMMLMTGHLNNPNEPFMISGGGTPIPTTQPTNPPTATNMPTNPTVVTIVPTTSATETTVPTNPPTTVPTIVPTAQPTTLPTIVPTTLPTAQPTTVPTTQPTNPPVVSVPQDIRTQQLVTTNNNQQVQFQIQIINDSQQTLNGVSWRFYFQVDDGATVGDYVFENYWDSTGSAQVQSAQLHAGNIYYFEFRYSTALTPNSTWQLNGALHLRDWSFSFTPSNDWSLQGGLTNQFRPTAYIPVFVNGQRIHGTTP